MRGPTRRVRAAEDARTAFAHDPEAAWERFIRSLADLDLGALTAALSDHVGQVLSPTVLAEQTTTLEAVVVVLDAAREHGLVRADVTAEELVAAVGSITRPLPAAVLRTAPRLPEQLVTILVTGLRP